MQLAWWVEQVKRWLLRSATALSRSRSRNTSRFLSACHSCTRMFHRSLQQQKVVGVVPGGLGPWDAVVGFVREAQAVLKRHQGVVRLAGRGKRGRRHVLHIFQERFPVVAQGRDVLRTRDADESGLACAGKLFGCRC